MRRDNYFSSRLFSRRPLCWRHKLFLVIETHLVTMPRRVDELGKDSDARGLIRVSTNLCDLSMALETVAFNDATPAEVLNGIPNPRHLVPHAAGRSRSRPDVLVDLRHFLLLAGHKFSHRTILHF